MDYSSLLGIWQKIYPIREFLGQSLISFLASNWRNLSMASNLSRQDTPCETLDHHRIFVDFPVLLRNLIMTILTQLLGQDSY